MVSTPVQSSISVSKPTHDVTWRQQFPGEGSECYYINGEILSATGFEDTSLSISLTDEKDSTNSVVTPSVQVKTLPKHCPEHCLAWKRRKQKVWIFIFNGLQSWRASSVAKRSDTVCIIRLLEQSKNWRLWNNWPTTTSGNSYRRSTLLASHASKFWHIYSSWKKASSFVTNFPGTNCNITRTIIDN